MDHGVFIEVSPASISDPGAGGWSTRADQPCACFRAPPAPMG